MSCRALYLRQQLPDQGKSFVGQLVKDTGTIQSQSFFYRLIARCPAWAAEPAVSPRRTGTNLPSLDKHHIYTVVNQFLREDQSCQPATHNSDFGLAEAVERWQRVPGRTGRSVPRCTDAQTYL